MTRILVGTGVAIAKVPFPAGNTLGYTFGNCLFRKVHFQGGSGRTILDLIHNVNLLCITVNRTNIPVPSCSGGRYMNRIDHALFVIDLDHSIGSCNFTGTGILINIIVVDTLIKGMDSNSFRSISVGIIMIQDRIGG